MRQVMRFSDSFLTRLVVAAILSVFLFPAAADAAGRKPVSKLKLYEFTPPTSTAGSDAACVLPAPAPRNPADQGAEKESTPTISPFISSERPVAPLETPERPAIAATDSAVQPAPEVTAGITVELGDVGLNLGYTVPSSRFGDLVRPLGENRPQEPECSRFSLGVAIPF